MITLSSKLLISVVAELLLSFVSDKYGLRLGTNVFEKLSKAIKHLKMILNG